MQDWSITVHSNKTDSDFLWHRLQWMKLKYCVVYSWGSSLKHLLIPEIDPTYFVAELVVVIVATDVLEYFNGIPIALSVKTYAMKATPFVPNTIQSITDNNVFIGWDCEKYIYNHLSKIHHCCQEGEWFHSILQTEVADTQPISSIRSFEITPQQLSVYGNCHHCIVLLWIFVSQKFQTKMSASWSHMKKIPHLVKPFWAARNKNQSKRFQRQ